MTGPSTGGADFPLPPVPPSWPGSLLADPSWLSDRVQQVARHGGGPERRTNATLWWYSASAVLLGPAVQALALTGAGVEVSPSSIRFTVRANGYLERVRPGPALGGDPAASVLGTHLDEALAQIIEPLADVGRAGERALWAIAADSLATAVLSAAPVFASAGLPGGRDGACRLAVAIAEAAPRLRPLPRYVDVPVPGSATAARYVRRGSCCLLLRVPDGTCLTCPNQTPAERHARLAEHARSRL